MTGEPGPLAVALRALLTAERDLIRAAFLGDDAVTPAEQASTITTRLFALSMALDTWHDETLADIDAGTVRATAGTQAVLDALADLKGLPS